MNPAPGESVLDACAAPGGKTGQIWESMRGEGRLVAVEVNPSRRLTLEENLRRAAAQGEAPQLQAEAMLGGALTPASTTEE